MNYKVVIYVVVFICIFLQIVQAQDTLKTDEIFILKEYNPIIASEGVKISEIPQMIKVQTEKKPVQYTFIPKEFKVYFNPQKISPATMKREPLDKIYRGYLKAGVGSFLSSQVQAYYSTTRASKKMLGIQFSHRGFASEIKDKGYAGFLNEDIQLFGTQYLDHVKIGGSIGLQYDRIHYYGYDPVFFPQFDKKNTRQYYMSPSLTFNVGNILSKKDSSSALYDATFSYRYLQDDYNSKENNPVARIHYIKPVGKSKLVANGLIDYNSFSRLDSLQSQSVILGLSPTFVTKYEDYELTLGVGLFLNQAIAKTELSIKPIADIRVPLFDHILVPYVGIDGGIERNNFQNFRTLNPFIHSSFLLLDNSDTRYRFYGGLKCILSSKVQIDAYAQTKVTRQAPLFINDTFGIVNHYFLVIYDNIQTNSLHGELSYFTQDQLSFFVKADFYSYATSKESSAWHLPSAKITTSAQYNLYDKILLRSDIFYVGSRFTKLSGFSNGQTITNTLRVEQLRSYVDLNLSAEYRYTNKISAYLDVYNVFGQRYERFYNYPTQTITILGGVKFLF